MNDNNRQPPGTAWPVPQEPERDQFSRFSKTPHLSDETSETPEPIPDKDLSRALENELKGASDKEDFYNRLRLFKRDRSREIASLESSPFKNRREIVRRLSSLADTIARAAYVYVEKNMPPEFGKPGYLSSYKQIAPASMAVVGMGRHGAREMNYESDLDLIFIFSHVGETNGARPISNAEYFTKFAQRFVNLLSVLTGAGRCYEIDVELRPSGNAGPLVTSIDHFLDHQMNRAQEWELMALLRARTVAISEDFRIPLNRHLRELSFKRPVPPNFFKTMADIRERVLKEKSKDAPGRLDLKLGRGGIMDVTFILQGLQIKNQAVFPELRKRGVFELLDAIAPRSFLKEEDRLLIEEAYSHYLAVEARLHLEKLRAEHVFEPDSEDAEKIAAALGFSSKNELDKKLSNLRDGVRVLYERMYHAP